MCVSVQGRKSFKASSRRRARVRLQPGPLLLWWMELDTGDPGARLTVPPPHGVAHGRCLASPHPSCKAPAVQRGGSFTNFLGIGLTASLVDASLGHADSALSVCCGCAGSREMLPPARPGRRGLGGQPAAHQACPGPAALRASRPGTKDSELTCPLSLHARGRRFRPRLCVGLLTYRWTSAFVTGG